MPSKSIEPTAKTISEKEAGKKEEKGSKKESKGGTNNCWTPKRGGDRNCKKVKICKLANKIVKIFVITGGCARGASRCSSDRNWRIKWMKKQLVDNKVQKNIHQRIEYIFQQLKDLR